MSHHVALRNVCFPAALAQERTDCIRPSSGRSSDRIQHVRFRGSVSESGWSANGPEPGLGRVPTQANLVINYAFWPYSLPVPPNLWPGTAARLA